MSAYAATGSQRAYLAAQPAVYKRRQHANPKRPLDNPRHLPFEHGLVLDPILGHINRKILPLMLPVPALAAFRLGRMPDRIVVLKHALCDDPNLLEQLEIDGDGGKVKARVGRRDPKVERDRLVTGP